MMSSSFAVTEGPHNVVHDRSLQDHKKNVSVTLRVANITREGLSRLEAVLGQWAQWHKQTYQQGIPPEVQLLAGTLAFDLTRLYKDGVIDWLDTLHLAPGTGAAIAGSKACHYEQAEAPPLYDRASTELLTPPLGSSTGANTMPSGAAAARRRQLVDAIAGEATSAATSAVKRRRLPNQRCFNCGSYAHALGDCTKPRDEVQIATAKAEAAAGRAAYVGNMARAYSMKQRYFEGQGTDSKPNPYEGIKPGSITQELAAALGLLNNLAPPPWISRMAVLGIPPKYQQAAVNGAKGSIPAEACEFIMGSASGDDEEVEEAYGNTNGVMNDPSDADFVPIDGVKAAPNGHKTGQQNGQQQQQRKQDAGQQMDKQQQQNAAAGTHVMAQQENTAKGTASMEDSMTVASLYKFPGVNAPLPAGADADAWQAELEKA